MQVDLQAQLGFQALADIALKRRVRVDVGGTGVGCGCQAHDTVQDGRPVGVMWGHGTGKVVGQGATESYSET